jgi:NADPH2:quinone reductase
VCTEERLKGVPEGWSFADAAGVFVTAPTSYAGLVVRAGIKKGMFTFHRVVLGGCTDVLV